MKFPHAQSVFRSAMWPDVPLYLSVPLWRYQYGPLAKVSANLGYQPPDVLAAAGLAYLASFKDAQSLFLAVGSAVRDYGKQGDLLKLNAALSWPDLPKAVLKSLNSSKL